jgi:flagellar basal body-associated protein FliL
MAAFLLFILAGVILVITFWNFKKKPAPAEDQRSDYLKTAVNKLRGDPKIQQNSSRWLFRSSVESRRDYYRTNAHILSASVPDKDSMCRATVIVNHSPANDSVVVLVTLQYPRSS